MTYRGYSWENEVKKKYLDKGIVLNLKINSYADLLYIPFCVCGVYLIECKSTKKSKWYPNKRERKQYEKLMELSSNLKGLLSHIIQVRYWIKENGIEKRLKLEEVGREYFKNV